jgi:N-methylhydantoinase A
MPGPACYGRGGEMPTITDCNLVMGHLSADNFLGGQMRLDLARARDAVMKVAEPLRIDPVAAAEGIVRVIEVKMEEAIKAISTMRGHDLRDFMLLAFGGAGPLHAARIARDLGMAGLIVPLYPGVYSAIGLIMSDVKHDYVRSRMQPISGLSVEDVNGIFGPLGAQAIADLVSDGFAPEHIDIQRAIDLRYAGQGYEITIPWTPPSPASGGVKGAGGLAGLRSQFDQQHQSMFGHMAPGQPVEVVSYRVRGLGRVPPVELPRFKPTGATLANAWRESRRARLDGRDIDCPVYQRERLDVGMAVVGPAVLDQLDCTTVIHAGQTARVDEWKNLIVTQEPPA